MAAPLNLSIPVSLKKLLLEDWELITKKELLVPVPRNPNVNEIIKQFLEKYKKEIPANVGEEISVGLKEYFTKSLNVVLYYTIERDDMMSLVQRNGGDPCSVLGAEHLLRLFVRLPELMPTGSLSEEARLALQDTLNMFLQFLDNKKKVFITKDYLSIAQQTSGGAGAGAGAPAQGGEPMDVKA